MARQTIEDYGIVYTIAMDDEIPISERNWAIVKGRVIDEITGEPPKTLVDIKTEHPGLIPKAANDGLVGLIGIPARLFPELNIQDYSFQLTVEAAGYIPLGYENRIGPIGQFPAEFEPFEIPEGDLSLHREPILISGRVIDENGTTITPISNAAIIITGIWRLLSDDINDTDTSEAPNIVSLQPSLYFNREAGTARLRRHEMVPVANEDKHILRHTHDGSNVLHISNRINIGTSDIIVIDDGDTELTEYLTIDDISGSSSDSESALVTLTHPVAKVHRIDSIVKKVNPQVPGADNLFNSNAISGDVCVFLDSMTDLDSANVVHIHDGSNPDEYHILRRFSVTSNSNGYFRLPPISRVVQVKIEVQHGPSTIEKDLTIDYSLRENRIDFKI